MERLPSNEGLLRTVAFYRFRTILRQHTQSAPAGMRVKINEKVRSKASRDTIIK